ncbi:MAG: DUF748 domain-containing protein [Gammaproteobacteria bacterium]|nr:DUF748 domain-containing protein [Gammaproteobacteria bacterium]
MLLLKRLLIACIALYYGVTLLIITPALNFLPAWYVEKHYERTLDTGLVVLNPFKLSLDISRAELSETSGEPFLSFGDTSINLSLSSLWQRGWVLDELRMHELAVTLVRLDETHFNFSDLLPAPAPEQEDEAPAEIPAVTLSLLDFQANEITLIDQSRSKPYRGQWRGLAFTVHDLSTVFEDGKPYKLDVTGPDGGTLAWQGHISIPRGHSDGTLKIEGLSLVDLWQLAEPWVEFEVASGKLDVSGSYDVKWGEALSYSLGNGAVSVRALSVVPGATAELGETGVQLDLLALNNISALSETRHAAVASVEIDGFRVKGWSEGSSASIVTMLMGEQPDTAADPATDNPPSDATQPDQMATAEAAGSAPEPGATPEDAAASPAETAHGNALAQEQDAGAGSNGDSAASLPSNDSPAESMEPAQDTSATSRTEADRAAPSPNNPAGALPMDDEQWSAAVGRIALRNSALHWRSEFTDPPALAITPIAATVSDLNWPLRGVSPFTLSVVVNDSTSLELDGSIDPDIGNGTVNYALRDLPLPLFNPNLPQALHAKITDGTASVTGSATVEAFAPGQVTADGAIRNFAIEIHDTENVLTGWDSVALASLRVDVPAQSVTLDELRIDGYQGRLHIFEDGSINASKVWRAELADADNADETATENTAPAADVAPTEDASTAAVANSDNAAPWMIDVRSVILHESKIDFMDQSLPIPFRTIIGDINGAIKNLNSDAAIVADVDIKGAVDTYAPVALTGTMNPLAAPMSLDLNLTFDGVDMAMLSPYSATYAGYRIDSGLLDLDLTYALENDALKGMNKVRLDKLKLGEKIASDKAIDAPLELALAILTDANGVIDMQVPVAGNVDDPSFALGGVIAKAFIGLFTKVITAPFSILASLVDSEEDLRQLTFPVGSAQIDEPTALKLDDIAKIMQQRPKIDLALTGRVNPAADRDRLQKNALDVQLLESGLSAQSLAARDEDWERAINARFRDNGGDPDDETLTIRDKQLRIIKTLEVSDEQLQALAQARAAAVKTYLVTQAAIDVERVVIRSGDIKDKEHRYNGVELDID